MLTEIVCDKQKGKKEKEQGFFVPASVGHTEVWTLSELNRTLALSKMCYFCPPSLFGKVAGAVQALKRPCPTPTMTGGLFQRCCTEKYAWPYLKHARAETHPLPHFVSRQKITYRHTPGFKLRKSIWTAVWAMAAFKTQLSVTLLSVFKKLEEKKPVLKLYFFLKTFKIRWAESKATRKMFYFSPT